MNEAGDATVGLSVYILLALWWAFVSALSLFTADLNLDQKNGSQAKTFETGPENAADRTQATRTEATFDESAFLEGAGRAYEMIVGAFAEGSLEILRPLLAGAVFESFAAEIERRRTAGEVLEFSFVGLSGAHIEATRAETPWLEIDIRFDAEIVRAVRDESGNTISGAPDQIEAVHDLWTFRREAPDAPWLLVATDAA